MLSSKNFNILKTLAPKIIRPQAIKFSSFHIPKYDVDHKRSIDPSTREQFWAQQAQKVVWHKKWDKTLDQSGSPYFYRWYQGGQINAVYNCIDRHVDNGHGNYTALIHQDCYNNKINKMTFKQLQEEVGKFSRVLSDKFGIKKGDRVVIYMPMMTQAYIAIYAVARLGAIHSVVFGGFAPKELSSRIKDANPKGIFMQTHLILAIITASYGQEPNKKIDYLKFVQKATQIAERQDLPKIAVQRDPNTLQKAVQGQSNWHNYHNLMKQTNSTHDCVPVQSNDPLYILYTSGTTGAPKGIVRGHAGTAVCLNFQLQSQQDIHLGNTYFAASDIGWIVGHSYSIYGPLIRGAASIIFEGKPTNTPDAGKFWDICEKYQVDGMYTSPTAIRSIKREDYDGSIAKKYPLKKLKSIAMAGQRCDTDTVEWIQKNLPHHIEFQDNWWQTEVGFPICTSHINNYRFPIVAGSTNMPNFGYDVRILNDQNQEVQPHKQGKICIKLPLSPTFMSTLWGNDQAFKTKYLKDTPGFYTSGDSGYKDSNGYVYVMARVDDVINTAAHRLSTGQMEQILNQHPSVIQSSVVAKHDQLKGEVPFAFIVLSKGLKGDDKLATDLNNKIRNQIGAIAKLEGIRFVENLPKTRSGKIIRACIKQIVNNQEVKIPATIDNQKAIQQVYDAFHK